MAKFVIFLLLGVALASAASSLPESPKLSNITGREEVVLVMGNARSGKTTLAALLGGMELNASAVGDGYTYLITNEKNLISSSFLPRNDSSINIFTDVQSNTIFYDLPGFGETDRVCHYAPIAYVRDEIAPFTKSVKILLVVSHSSVRLHESRRCFPDMLNEVVRIVNDIERYGNAIAMVVNKVENSAYEVEDEVKLFKDESIIDDVAYYLTEEKIYSRQKKSSAT